MAKDRASGTIDGIEFEIRLKRMKTIRIHVDPPDGRVWVSAPLGTPRTRIEAVVERHLPFILERRSKLLSSPAPAPEDLLGGGFVRLLGVDVPVTCLPAADQGVRVELRDDRLEVTGNAAQEPARVRAEIERIQWTVLERELTRLVPHWEARMNRSASWWGIRRMQTRWGSCSPKSGRIRFALNLATQHPREIEYIVVHELAHLQVPNHSPAFWSLVERHLPDWRERHHRLRSRQFG